MGFALQSSLLESRSLLPSGALRPWERTQEGRGGTRRDSLLGLGRTGLMAALQKQQAGGQEVNDSSRVEEKSLWPWMGWRKDGAAVGEGQRWARAPGHPGGQMSVNRNRTSSR